MIKSNQLGERQEEEQRPTANKYKVARWDLLGMLRMEQRSAWLGLLWVKGELYRMREQKLEKD